MNIPTIKVKPWGEGQGDHVLINACDFDPKAHKLIEGESLPEFEVDGVHSPVATRLDPLDHDADGRRGGSRKGAASTRAKGAKRKGKAK